MKKFLFGLVIGIVALGAFCRTDSMAAIQARFVL